jgi:hypothetical protein
MSTPHRIIERDNALALLPRLRHRVEAGHA